MASKKAPPIVDDQETGRNVPGIGDEELPPEDLGEKPATEGESVKEMPDGSAVVTMAETPRRADDEFYANLADGVVEQIELDNIASDLLELIEIDRESRSKRDEQYEEGIKRTGMGKEAPGGAQFFGASRAVHPALAEACIDFAARAIKELFQPSGPVKTHILGEVTQAKMDKATRKRDFLNYQLTQKIAEYRADLEKLLTQLPLGGSQYQKFLYDTKRRRIAEEFVPVDRLLMPYGAANLQSAERVTHIQDLTSKEFEERVTTGLYIDIDALLTPNTTPEATRAEKASQKVEGVQPDSQNRDGLRRLFEVHVLWPLTEDDLVPEDEYGEYIITVDETNRKTCAIYRNWSEKDEARARLEWFVDWNFIPWRGAVAAGLPQIIGSLVGAATGAVRALLDSAHVNNAPSLATLKGTKMSGQNTQIQIAGVTELEGPVNTTDIRDLMMPIPYNPPSAVLFSLLGWLDEKMKGVVSTADEKIADATGQMPMGTALALIEQGSQVFSAIHARLHDSQRRALAIISRLLAENLDDNETIEELGADFKIKRSDFLGPLDVIPVSDPNIFSETQRYAQVQFMMGLMDKYPEQFKRTNVIKRALTLAKIPEIEEVLNEPKGPQELNFAAENVASMMKQPIIAFPNQDHIAHFDGHLRFLMDPLYGANPAAAPVVFPPMLEHLMQHITLFYAHKMDEIASRAMGQDISGLMKQKGNSERVDRVLAAAAPIVHSEIAKQFAPVMPMLQQVVQIAKSLMPKPPMDPTQVAMAESERRAEHDKADLAQRADESQKRFALDMDKLSDSKKKELVDSTVKILGVLDDIIRAENEGTQAANAQNLDLEGAVDRSKKSAQSIH